MVNHGFLPKREPRQSCCDQFKSVMYTPRGLIKISRSSVGGVMPTMMEAFMRTLAWTSPRGLRVTSCHSTCQVCSDSGNRLVTATLTLRLLASVNGLFALKWSLILPSATEPLGSIAY